MFQQAIDLMTERCPSMALVAQDSKEEPLVQNANEPFGVQVPKYFYIQQKNPSPMAPLPVSGIRQVGSTSIAVNISHKKSSTKI